MEREFDTYKVKIFLMWQEAPMIIHITEKRTRTIWINVDSVTYDYPVTIAHELAEELITKGSSVKLDTGAKMYIPAHRVRSVIVEKA